MRDLDRCLGSAVARGYRIVLGAEPGSTGAERSRFVDEIWTLPQPERGVEAFRDALAERLRSDPGIAFVIPKSEIIMSRVP